jgi:hypothetical protein
LVGVLQPVNNPAVNTLAQIYIAAFEAGSNSIGNVNLINALP